MIKDGYFICCDKKIQPIDDKTIHIGKIYCRWCKKYHDVNIINGEMFTKLPIFIENELLKK